MKRATLALVAAFAAIVATAETSRTATENWTRNRIAEATNGLRRVDAEARPLPAYLHAYQFADAYPEDAAWYYQFADMGGACSSVRNGNDYARNFDLTYDERAEFVVEMIAGPGRLASVGVANVGTNLTEAAVTSGARSRFYKALPGATVDGINSEGIVCSINLVPTNGAPWETKGGRDLNALGVVRFVLDTATSASNAAAAVASRCYIPDALKRKGYSAHFMLADERETWIVEDGTNRPANGRAVLTNYRLFADNDPYGTGYERFNILAAGGNITSAWFRAAYRRPFSRPTEFAAPGVGTHSETDALLAWAEANIPQGAPESLTRNGHSWQTVHTSRFDISNRVLRVAVQERPDWYTFQVPATAPKIDAYTKSETDEMLAGKADVEMISENDETFKEAVVRSMNSTGISSDAISIGGTISGLSVSDQYGDLREGINTKADRADSSGTVLTDELATLDADGNPTRSGIAKEDVITTDGGTVDGDLEVTGNAEIANLIVRDIVGSLAVDSLTISETDPVDLTTEDGVLADSNGKYAHLSNISATDPTFSNAVMGVASHTNADFAAEVLAVQVASLSTNITAEVYIAATNACANLGIDPALIPQGGTLGTVGGLLLALAAAVALLRKKTALLENDGKPSDTFATDLLGKQVANVKANTTAIAPAFSDESTYAVGDTVTHDGNLYTCITEISTAGAWDSSKWDLTPVNALIDAKIGDVNAVLAAALDGTEVA